MSLGTPRFLEKNFSIKGRKNDLSPDFSCGFLKKKKLLLRTFVLKSYALNLEDSFLELVLRETSTHSTRHTLYYKPVSGFYLYFKSKRITRCLTFKKSLSIGFAFTLEYAEQVR